MKWITHQTGAALAALALELPLPGVGGAFAGAILPDVLDQRASRLGRTRRQQQRIFNRIHRGPTHWFGWWLGLLCVAATCPLPPLARDAAAGIAFGALSHVLLDMLTPHGVPLTPFSRKGRLAVPLCSTGRLSEYLFLGAMLALGAIFLKAPFLALVKDLLNSY